MDQGEIETALAAIRTLCGIANKHDRNYMDVCLINGNVSMELNNYPCEDVMESQISVVSASLESLGW